MQRFKRAKKIANLSAETFPRPKLRKTRAINKLRELLNYTLQVLKGQLHDANTGIDQFENDFEKHIANKLHLRENFQCHWKVTQGITSLADYH